MSQEVAYSETQDIELGNVAPTADLEAGQENIPIITATVVSSRGHHFYVVKANPQHSGYAAEKMYQEGLRNFENYSNEALDGTRAVVAQLSNPAVTFITIQSTPSSYKKAAKTLRRNRILSITIFFIALFMLVTLLSLILAMPSIASYTVWFNIIPLVLFLANTAFVRCPDLLVRVLSVVSFLVGLTMIVVGVITILVFAIYLASLSKAGIA